jgi:UDP-2,3-diacylglucosamine pyrophosphatase LpxH
MKIIKKWLTMIICCASDFHIGYEGTNYKKLLEFFKVMENDVDKLILCGDILDLWRSSIDEIRSNSKTRPVFEGLKSLAERMDITYIWGNHDYNISKKWKEANDLFTITDEFKKGNMYFCHGWRFDLQQRFGYWLYGWLVDYFPKLYQIFFKKPFEIKNKEEEYNLLSQKIHAEAREFIKSEKLDYLFMGHTHSPKASSKLFDCGDLIDSLSYVIIENGKPKLERLDRN